MITAEIKKYLIQISNGQHNKKLVSILNKKGLTTARSNPYNIRTVKRIMDGLQEDLPAEVEIIEYYEYLKKQKELTQNLTQKLITIPETETEN